MRIKGSRVLVTGASSGIGRLTALALARRGATEVLAVARSGQALARLAAEHPAIRPVVADLNNPGDRARLDALVSEVDVLVNNAGVGWIGLVEDMGSDDVRRLYEVNVLAPIELTQAALPGMLERRHGCIVNVTSASAWVAHPPLSVYGSTKWALQGFSEGLRRELHDRGVTVNTINPGPVQTGFAEAARHRDQPSEELSDSRMPGIPAAWVARAVVRAIRFGTLPGYQVIAVPRLMGLSRLGGVPITGWSVDLVTLVTTRLRRARHSAEHALAWWRLLVGYLLPFGAALAFAVVVGGLVPAPWSVVVHLLAFPGAYVAFLLAAPARRVGFGRPPCHTGDRSGADVRDVA